MTRPPCSFADSKLKRKFVLATVGEAGFALEYDDATFKNDEERVLGAISQDGDSLEFARAGLKRD